MIILILQTLLIPLILPILLLMTARTTPTYPLILTPSPYSLLPTPHYYLTCRTYWSTG